MNEFIFKNELLQQAMWGGSLCKNGYMQHCNGYFNADVCDYGRAFIEYCVSRMFNIHRVPGHEAYYIQEGSRMKLNEEFGLLKRDDIMDACTEFEKYYYFLQNELKDSAFVRDGKIKLVRSLRPFEIDIATPQLKEGKEFITMPCNIINSYAHDNQLYCYGSTMSIVREVDIEKIVMYFKTLHHPSEVCCHINHGGEYEVWVMEDDMFGQVTIPKECFHYTELQEVRNDRIRYRYHKEEEGPLYTGNAIDTRPCEWNKFTKWIIKRNQQKIRELFGLEKNK